jgi:hypothetical protein
VADGGLDRLEVAVTETVREQAERLAGPHGAQCEERRFRLGNDECICAWRAERVAALEAAIREAEEPWRRFAWLVHGHVGLYGDDGEMQCSVNGAADFKRDPSARLIEHAIKALQDVVAEARRQGREDAATLVMSRGNTAVHRGLAAAIRALPLDGPGEEGR